MNYVEIELERKEFNAESREFESKGTDVYMFRLTSSAVVELEKKTGKSIADFMQDFSVGNLVTLLRYMLKWYKPTMSTEEGYSLYDQFVLNGYDIQQIQNDVVLETLIVSGFFKREALQENQG